MDSWVVSTQNKMTASLGSPCGPAPGPGGAPGQVTESLFPCVPHLFEERTGLSKLLNPCPIDRVYVEHYSPHKMGHISSSFLTAHCLPFSTPSSSLPTSEPEGDCRWAFPSLQTRVKISHSLTCP